MLWSADEDAVPTGSLVDVYQESRINDTYEIAVEGSSETMEMAQWRIAFSRDQAAVASLVAANEPVDQLFARSQRTPLPVRAEKSNHPSVRIVYRLQEGEVMKVLERDAEPTNLSGLEARWYRVLTEGGIEGWVFGYYLDVFDLVDGPQESQRVAGAADPLLEALTSGVWRPVHFRDMMRSGAIDLSVFGPAFGLFPNPEEKRFDLVLPTLTRSFVYDRIISGGFRRYEAEGTSLVFEIPNPEQMSIQFTHEGRQRSVFLERMDEDIEAIAQAERERRRERYLALRGEDESLTSSAYGTIRLGEDQTFRWTDYDRLVPRFVPAEAGSGGTVELSLHLAPELREAYDGVVSFRFDGTTRDQMVSFLYDLAGDGVRLVFVPPELVEEQIVTGEPRSPLVIFFSRS